MADDPPTPRVLIVADNASYRFGGESVLPVHYFDGLRRCGVAAWLLAHDRSRAELTAAFPDAADRLAFAPDTWVHRLLYRLGQRLPHRLDHLSTAYLLRLLTQRSQKRLATDLIARHRINVVHQPMPVSPKEPSLWSGMGVPVVIGPMNGNIGYPPGFRHYEGWSTRLAVALGRWAASPMNRLIPGKRRARMLLVANARTADALPGHVRGEVVQLVENGVDLSVWRQEQTQPAQATDCGGPVRFVWVGRMVDWKAVDCLLTAFARVAEEEPCELILIGDGPQRAALEAQARQHDTAAAQRIRFVGWLGHRQCAAEIHAADVFVLPSLMECGGAVVLEAMAMSKPVIATRWGGPVDYLDDQCGMLILPHSRADLIEGLAQAMLKLARDPAMRQAMGENGRRKVLDHFTWEAKIHQMLGLYQRSLQPWTHESGRPGRGDHA